MIANKPEFKNKNFSYKQDEKVEWNEFKIKLFTHLYSRWLIKRGNEASDR